MSDQQLLYITILITSVLGLGLAFVAYSYRDLVKKYDLLKKDKEAKEEQQDLEGKKIVDEAKLKAQQIIKEAELVTDEVKNAITSDLKAASSVQAKQYQQALIESKDQMVNLMDGISKNIQGEALKEIEEFTKKLEIQTAQSEKGIQAVMAEANKKIEAQLNAYKNARMKQIDSVAIETIKQVTKDVLGKAISPIMMVEAAIIPTQAAKMVPISMVAMARPPLNPPSHK